MAVTIFHDWEALQDPMYRQVALVTPYFCYKMFDDCRELYRGQQGLGKHMYWSAAAFGSTLDVPTVLTASDSGHWRTRTLKMSWIASVSCSRAPQSQRSAVTT
jgi:hypothetical protein